MKRKELNTARAPDSERYVRKVGKKKKNNPKERRVGEEGEVWKEKSRKSWKRFSRIC
jgi:hypothetical protein